VSGSVSAIPTSVILASVDSLSGFTYVEGSGPSTAQSFTITASGLSPASGNVTITPSSSFEVSITSATTGFSGTASVTLPYTSGGTLANNTIWVRLKAGLTAGSYSSTINSVVVSGGGGSDSVLLSGTITAASGGGSTPVTIYTYPSSGYGTTGTLAVNKAYNAPVTLYSDSSTIGVGSNVYIDASGTTILPTYTYVFISGFLWNYNPSTGKITAFTYPQP
jgi:hypothetical protein